MLKYKYQVNVKVEIKVDDKLKYIIEGGTTYATTAIKQTGWGTYSEDGGVTKVPFCGHPDIKKRSLMANVTDRIIKEIIVK